MRPFLATATLILGVIGIPASYGIQPDTNHNSTQENLIDLRKADRELMVSTWRSKQFEFLSFQIESTSQVVCTTHCYNCDQLRKLVKNDKHKDMLVVNTAWDELFNSDREREREKVYQFCDRLGYKRVLYMGPTTINPQVWRDTLYENHPESVVKPHRVLIPKSDTTAEFRAFSETELRTILEKAEPTPSL